MGSLAGGGDYSDISAAQNSQAAEEAKRMKQQQDQEDKLRRSLAQQRIGLIQRMQGRAGPTGNSVGGSVAPIQNNANLSRTIG